jgi:IMP dehydrogenase/GMP reductase
MFFKFEDAVAANYQLTYDDVLLNQAPVSDINSRYGPNISPYHRNENGYYQKPFDALPIVASPMPSIAGHAFMDAITDSSYKPFAVFADRFRPEHELDEMHARGCGISIGLDYPTDKLIHKVSEYEIAHVLVDIANGNLDALYEYLLKLQDLRFDEGVFIWAGNVTNELAYARLASLCDYIRVGIGGGSACTTRINTGVGAGNVTALARCHAERKRLVYTYPKDVAAPAYIVADGGVRNNGDICKALASGADLVMLGKMFTATSESAANSVLNEETGIWYKEYAGLASSSYNKKSSIEGQAGLVHMTEPVADMLKGIEGNLRSAMSYTNSHTLAELQNCTKLICSPTITSENNTSLVR